MRCLLVNEALDQREKKKKKKKRRLVLKARNMICWKLEEDNPRRGPQEQDPSVWM